MKLIIAFTYLFTSTLLAQHPLGWKPDVGGVKDKAFINHPRFSGTKIAVKSDLRDLMPPVYDQGNIGSCTGNGAAACLDYAHVKSTPNAKFFNPSRLFIYYGAREIEGTTGSDNGAQIRDVVTVILTSGAPPESMWPYVPSRFATRPNQSSYTSALKTQALHSYKAQSTEDIKRALSMKLPVVFGIPVYKAIQDMSWSNYTLPMPKHGERSIGGHCMVIVGHDDSKSVFIIRNSWGVGWGRAGHCLMPYDYWNRFRLNTDAWVTDIAE